MNAIETHSLTKRFGDDVLAVDSLDLTVESGEIFGFLGPNGAGKSTTINLLLDFVRPDEGSATVLGFDAQRESDAVRERVGVLPEGASLYDRLTGREHVEWVAETKGADVDPDALLDRVGLDPAAILFAFAVGAVLTAAWYPALELPTFSRVVGLTLYFTLAYVSVAVGISALTASRSRAMAGAIGYFFVFNVLWINNSAFSVVGALRFVFEDTLGVELSQNTELFVQSLSPTVAYLQSLRLAFPEGYRDLPQTDPSTPYYLQPEFMLIILAAWIVLPLLVGWLRFERAELG